MKFIQTIIAFFTIYLFIGVIVVALLLSFWFASFIPNMPRQPLAEVYVGSLDSSGAPIVYSLLTSGNALKTMITRDVPQSLSAPQEVLSAKSQVIIATYTHVTLSETLVPLGFSDMYRLEKVTDASGKVIYSRQFAWLDGVATFVLQKYIQTSQQSESFIATSGQQTYTVIASTKGLEVNKQ